MRLNSASCEVTTVGAFIRPNGSQGTSHGRWLPLGDPYVMSPTGSSMRYPMGRLIHVGSRTEYNKNDMPGGVSRGELQREKVYPVG